MAIPKIKQRYVIPVGEYEKRPVSNGLGYMNVKVGEQDWEIEVQIDMDAIVRLLGTRAVRSKGGRAKNGHVTVKRIRKFPTG